MQRIRRMLAGLLVFPVAMVMSACGRESGDDAALGTADWAYYGGDEGGQRHSPLAQISPANVEQLEVAWTYHTGDLLDPTNADAAKQGSTHASTSFQNTPILVDRTLYLCTPFNRVIALDPETGREKWIFDPKVDLEGLYLLNCRGVTAWTDARADEGAYCQKRIFTGTVDGRMIALDAATGAQKWRRDLGAPMTGSPTIDDGRIFVTSNNNEVYAINLADGATLWSDQAISESARVLGSSSVAAVEDFVIAPFSSGEVIAYLAANGRRLWTDALTQAGRFTPISEINDIGSRPVLGAGLVFASSQSGSTMAIDGRSGARVWTAPVGSTRAPALAGRFLFVLGTENELTCLDAATGEAYWVVQLRQFQNEKEKKNRLSYSAPIVASGRVIVVSSRGELKAFSALDGTQTGSLKLGDTVYIEPIAAQGRLFVLTDDAKLIAID